MSDIVIYGGNFGGIVAAVRAARIRPGTTITIIEPWDEKGGMITGGLTDSDIIERSSYWGITREKLVEAQIYYGGDGHTITQTFEAHVFAAMLDALAAEADITWVYNEYVTGVTKIGPHIVSLETNAGSYPGKVFIEASYEGDFMAIPGMNVGCTYGREPRSMYGSSQAGLLLGTATVAAGTKTDHNGNMFADATYRDDHFSGQGDTRNQAMNFRLQVTTDPARKLPWPKPPGYDNAHQYFVDLIGSSSTILSAFLDINDLQITDKYEFNQNDQAGDIAEQWVTADHPTRLNVLLPKLQLLYWGQLYYRANDPNIDPAVRATYNAYGPAADEVPGGMAATEAQILGQFRAYCRTGRRLRSQKNLTEYDLVNNPIVYDSIAAGGYFADSHTIQRRPTVDGLSVESEGHTAFDHRQHYSIPLRSIKPYADQADNLLVVWCFGMELVVDLSARMEFTKSGVADSAGMVAARALLNMDAAATHTATTADVTYASILQYLLNESAVTRYENAA